MRYPEAMSTVDVEDYYGLLDVPHGADAGQIDRAWRRECFRWHPDRNHGREEEAHARFLLLGEAHAVLTDASAREAYDRVWHRVHGVRGFREDQRDRTDGPRTLFEQVVREASDSRSGAGEGPAFEREVAAVIRDLFSAHRRSGRTGRLVHVLQLAAVLLCFLAAQGLALALAASTRWETHELLLVAVPLPIFVSGICLRSWLLALRDRKLERTMRPLAERIVLARRRR